jgi:exodeoxyribonuclease VII small subunit
MDDNRLTFEESLARLEDVVERLESGELNLEESLRCFEEGVALQRRCLADLNAAQGKIERLMDEGDPTPVSPASRDGAAGLTGSAPGSRVPETLFGAALASE